MAQAAYVDDPNDLAARQAARRAATAAGAPLPSIQPPAPATPQAAPTPAAPPRYGNADIAAKVDQIGQRAANFRQQVQTSNIQAQTARVPGLNGAPAGPTSDLATRAAGASIQPSGPVSEIPSIQPQTVSTADMARAAPDSALARRVPGATFEQPTAGQPLSADALARAQRGVDRLTGAAPTPPPAQPSAFGTSTVAGEAAAPSAAANASGVAGDVAAAGRGAGAISRVASIAGKVGRGLGYISALGEGVQAAQDVRSGNYGDAATNGLLATADTLATRAPTPYTIIGALAGHGAAAAADTAPGQALTRGIANALPGSGASTADAAVADLQATMADRQRRGLPIPANYEDALRKAQGFAAGIRNEPSPGMGATADLISPGASERSRAANAASIVPTASAVQPRNPANTPVQFIDPYTSGPVGPPGRDGSPAPTGADLAMRSNTPGTAVINGRVLTPQDVASAGQRLNTVSSNAFTNPSLGSIYGALNGGATPTSAQAQALRERLGDNGGGRMFGNPADLERSSILGELRDQQAQRTKQMNRLTAASEAALAKGKKRAAGILANLAGQYSGEANYAPYLPAQARATTPGEQMLEAAQASEATARAADTAEQVGRRRQIASITDAIGQENNPRRRAALEAQVNALNGRTENNRAYTVSVPSNDVDANGSPIKYELLVSPDGRVLYDPRGTMTGKNVKDNKATP